MEKIDYAYGNEKDFTEIAKYLDVKLHIINDQSSFIETDSLNNKRKGFVLFRPKSYDDLRAALNSSKVQAIIGAEYIERKDKLHYRNSGLDDVLLRIARENNKSIAFGFSELLRLSPQKRNMILGRMRFNIRLCRKFKVNMIFGSFAKKPIEMRSIREINGFFNKL